MPSSAYCRLHVTPLDDKLITAILPASLLSLARNISYHTLDTFPERRYGYLELPSEEAEKLKKKLNGTTLRGAKMRIEKAREETTWREEAEGKKLEKKRKREKTEEGTSSKKKAKDPNVLEGVMPKDRKVKRGWTESPAEARQKKSSKETQRPPVEEPKKEKKKKEKQRIKSKYTNEPECLLNVKLPPNTLKNLPAEETGKLHQRRKKKAGEGREYTVHEFENTTPFPTFLRDSTGIHGPRTATKFVEGQGWLDDEGKVIETVKKRDRPKAPKKAKRVNRAPELDKVSEEDDTSSSGTSSSDASDGQSGDDETAATIKTGAESRSDQKSAQPTSSGLDDSSDSASKTPTQPRPTSSSSVAKPLSITIPPVTPSLKQVHPLEALYKRQPADSKPHRALKSEAFSFFSGNAETSDIEMDDDGTNSTNTLQNVQQLQPPMTPFSKQDFESRHMRSAAPTPDTAHPSRMHSFFSEIDAVEEQAEDEDDDDNDNDSDENIIGIDEDDNDEERKPKSSRKKTTAETGGQETGEQEKSEFETWFWKNRRDLNKNWMQRRKDAAKEKRHRDNKTRASRAV